MKWTAVFSGIGKNDALSAGGKGASLGELTQAGIPVPPGFVVVSSAFEYFLEAADLNQELDAILGTVHHDQIHTVEHASQKIQALILAAHMPDDIKREIEMGFKDLGAQYVAVRSSATAEDGAAAAWAGQLDTFLNTEEQNLLKNVQRCWASLFTPRAIFYRFEKGMHGQKISVAVVIQKMIESESSGIAFSVHPVTEDYNQLIIEAGFGLGEAIVSGQVTPDAYVVEKEPRRIIDTNISTQTRGLYRSTDSRQVAGAEGNEWKDIPEPKASSQVLSNKQVLELSELILKIEKHYGFPCDIEWAFEKETFYITQSRPITTLGEKQSESIKWTVIASDFNSFFVRNQIWVKGINRAGDIIPSLKSFTQTLAIRGRKGKIDYLVNLASWQEMHEIFSRELDIDLSRLQKIIEETNRYGDGAIHRAIIFGETPASQKSDQQLLDELNELIAKQEMLYAYGVLLPLLDLGDQIYIQKRINDALETLLPKEEVANAFSVLTQPLEDSFAVEEEKDLLNIALAIQESPSLMKAFTEGNIETITEHVEKDTHSISLSLSQHIKKYAWVYYAFAGPATTRAEYINFLIELVKAKPHDRLLEMENNTNTLRAEKDALIQKYAKDTYAQTLFKLAGTFVWAKPRRKDYQSCLYFYINEHYLAEIAKRVNATKEQLMSITFDDIESALRDKRINDSAKAAEILQEHILVPRDTGFDLYYGERAREINQMIRNPHVVTDTADSLKGMTGYKGYAQGRVVIINTPAEMNKLQEGDILVSVATTPSIVPAMRKAAAFVTDEGGLTCHAAIVAREMKKPCVIGTKIATQVLKDGDMVEVDADEGIVRILGGKAGGFKKDEYVLSFWVQGVSVFVTDIHRSALKELEVLFVLDNGMFKQYFTKSAYERALDRGLEFYSDEYAFDTYQKNLVAHCDAFTNFFESEIKGRKALTKEIVNDFFEYTKKLCGDYVKMNFEFTDKAFVHKEENSTIKKNLLGVAKFKDIIRAVMNMVLFEPEGYSNRFFAILGDQFELAPSLLENLTQKEILRLFEDWRPIEAVVSKRQEAFVERYDLDGFYEGKDAEVILQEFREEIVSSDTIRGQVANKGVVRGQVKIIPVDYSDLSRVHAEIEKMQHGDVLVAETTAPELIVACKKASAIITDMGGLMSHAAIVSREMGIPCIVGTKNASKILKDGDEVEVDADNGIVRKINHD